VLQKRFKNTHEMLQLKVTWNHVWNWNLITEEKTKLTGKAYVSPVTTLASSGQTAGGGQSCWISWDDSRNGPHGLVPGRLNLPHISKYVVRISRWQMATLGLNKLLFCFDRLNRHTGFIRANCWWRAVSLNLMRRFEDSSAQLGPRQVKSSSYFKICCQDWQMTNGNAGVE
jgi:hypothetical protein